MSDDDFDDELLALAGDAGDDEEETDYREKTGSGRNRGRDAFSSEDEGDDDEGSDVDVYVNPYPLEGKYKDKRDRDALMSMTEVERESILYDREEENRAAQEQQEMARRMKIQRAQQQEREYGSATRRTGRDTVGAAKQERGSKLQELKRKRESKQSKEAKEVARKKSRTADFSESEEEEEEEEEEAQEDDYDDSKSTASGEDELTDQDRDPSAQQPVDLKDVNDIRLSRKSIASIISRDKFLATAENCFVKLSLGLNHGVPAYRMCQIQHVKGGNRIYKFDGGENNQILTDLSLNLTHGKAAKDFEIRYISDRPITQAEFARWQAVMENEKQLIMKKGTAKQKFQSLAALFNAPVEAEELERMLVRKKKLSRMFGRPQNIAGEKAALKAKLQAARTHASREEIENLEIELNKLEELSSGKKVDTDLDRLAKLNERNRLRDMQINARPLDPLKRSTVQPTVKNENGTESSTPTLAKVHSDVPENESVLSQLRETGKDLNGHSDPVKNKPLSNVDEYVQSIDLDLDLNL